MSPSPAERRLLPHRRHLCPPPVSRRLPLPVNRRECGSRVEAHSGKPVILKLASNFDARYRVSAAIARPLRSPK
jgi:hypothetical protein